MSIEKAFSGKKVLVTGAGRGIGCAIVKKLNEYGAKVYALSKDPKNLSSLTQECPKVIPICVDLKDWNATKKALLTIETLDCLVNNAGIQVVMPFMNIQPDTFDSVMNVNLRAVVNVSQCVIHKMIDAGQPGSILNVSSISSKKIFPGNSIYTMTKSALESLTKCMAVELGAQKIRVNAICPGMVETDMFRHGIELSGNPDAVMEQFVKNVPLGQLLMPMEEVVNTALFLLSDIGSNITGESLCIDGGFLCT